MAPPSGAITSTRRSYSSKVSSRASAIVGYLLDRAVGAEEAADETEGARDVAGQCPSRGGFIAALQSLDQLPMVVDRQSVPGLVMGAGRQAHIRPGLQPQAFHDRSQHGGARRVIDIEVE